MPETALHHSNGRLTLSSLIAHFLTDLENANRSVHTRRAYATDLAQWSVFCGLDSLTPEADTLRAFFASFGHLNQTSRARKQASLASFFALAQRQGYVDVNPMVRIERVKLQPPLPRGIAAEQINAILTAIPARNTRDRLLFRLLAETGLRIGEALRLYVEDVDLTIDSERLLVHGKGGRQRSILLDDPRLVRQLKSYLTATGYRHGPLFRAQKNGRGPILSYQAVQKRWAVYCAKASITCRLHQLRHSHATALINGGVSIVTVRKRLGHKNLQTTLRYAEQTDCVADTEIRVWRRNHQ